MNIERTEPDTLPLWVKLCNPPLEALTIKGISALASRIGKPLIMDAGTASMCKKDVGRIGYARVLVEVSAKKCLPEKIDIVYQNAAKEKTGQKTVKVVYDWAPNMCSECGVFGHTTKMCHKSAKDRHNEPTRAAKNVNEDKVQNDGFTEVVNKKKGNKSKPVGGNSKPNNGELKRTNTVYQPKPQQAYKNNEKKTDSPVTKAGTESPPKRDDKKEKTKSPVSKKAGRNENKYSVLGSFEEEEELEIESMVNREKVDVFINMKKHPTLEECEDWNQDMMHYFKERWKLLIDKVGNDDTFMETEDVFSMNDGMAQEMNEGDVQRKDGNVLQDC
ncbi:zinc knuckle CX2CX4HX4C containing protein [Tanacetum coccineum]